MVTTPLLHHLKKRRDLDVILMLVCKQQTEKQFAAILLKGWIKGGVNEYLKEIPGIICKNIFWEARAWREKLKEMVIWNS